MFDISGIKISSSTRIKDLQLPTRPTNELAYFCGLLAGDGHIAAREHKSDYYVICAGNPYDEKKFYDSVICHLVKKLFNIDVQPKTLQDTYGICIRSKPFVEYLTTILGLPKNRKYAQLSIPQWVKQNKKFIVNYIRGLADTDFCLSLKKRYKTTHYYPVISGCSESKNFINEIALELAALGLNVAKHYDYYYPDNRLKAGYYMYHRICVNGHTQLIKWMQLIGFSSPKHLEKYNLWRARNQDSNRSKTLNALLAAKEIKGLESPSFV